MDLLNLSNPDPKDFGSPQFESDDAFAAAERSKSQVISARERLERAKKYFRFQQDSTKTAAQTFEVAKLYLEQLRGGWGAPIAWVGPATLYEFWLDIPGYNGPVRGFSASSTQTGNIQHVSHVTSKTTSGAGCATLGCLAAGPVGAVAGATMGKKNDVKTNIEVVDHRRFEIQIIGPSVAWSYVGNYTIEESVRSFRDLLLARSTNTDDPKLLAVGHEQVVTVKKRSADLEYDKLKEADERLRSSQYTYETAWSNYEAARLPVVTDLLARWKISSVGVKIASIVFGPVVLLAWIAGLIFRGSPDIVAISVMVAIVQFLSLVFLGVYYRIEYRLLKTLPSESSKLEPLVRFFDRLQKRRNPNT